MSLAEQMLADANRLLPEVGIVTLYHSKTLGALTRTGYFERQAATITTDDGRRVEYGASVTYSTDATSGLAAWHESDWLEIGGSGGERWEVVAAQAIDAMRHTVALMLRRIERVRYAGRDHEKGPA